MSATHLKMVGRQRDEEVAERLKEPASGTVANGLGSVGTTRETGGSRTGNRRDVESLCFMR
jgi:hypothetical protein